MPIQLAIWKVGDIHQPLAASQLASEQKLEEVIVRDPRIAARHENKTTLSADHRGEQK